MSKMPKLKEFDVIETVNNCRHLIYNKSTSNTCGDLILRVHGVGAADIVRIYRPLQCETLEQLLDGQTPINPIWIRPEPPKKLTVNQISNILGYKVEVIEEE